MGSRRSIVLSIAAVLLSLLAYGLASRARLPLPPVERWEAAHPDPRPMDAAELRAVAAMGAEERRVDGMLLLIGLAVGCGVVAVRPALARVAGSTAAAILAAGSIAVGLTALGASAATQLRDAREGHWSLSDDVLPRLAGPHADTLRAWRERIGEDDVVLLLGTDPRLWNAVLWALHPRAVHPRAQAVPRDMRAEEIAEAARRLAPPRDGAARWVVDLAVLRSPEGAGHPALVQVDG